MSALVVVAMIMAVARVVVMLAVVLFEIVIVWHQSASPLCSQLIASLRFRKAQSHRRPAISHADDRDGKSGFPFPVMAGPALPALRLSPHFPDPDPIVIGDDPALLPLIRFVDRLFDTPLGEKRNSSDPRCLALGPGTELAFHPRVELA